jgi:hypothetical protein
MSNIIINDVNPYDQYLASAGQTIFTYSFPIFEETDLGVYLTPVGFPPDDANQKLIVNTDYTITDVGAEAGGTIVLTVPATLNDRITIRREMLYNRTQNYANFTDFNVEVFNRDFNRLWMMGQENRMMIEKFLAKYQNSILFDDANLKLPGLAEGQIWKMVSGGIASVTPIEEPDITTLRSELANDQPGTDGARLIGFYDAVLGGITVHDALINAKVGLYGVDTGAANAYAVTLSPAPTTYATIGGLPVQVSISNNNTGASTLNVNGLGVKNIIMAYQGAMVALPPDSLISGMMAQFVYDPVADNVKLMNPDRLADFKTGWVLYTYEQDGAIPSGWIPLDDGTIGNAASGATTRANADTQALYTLLWDNVSSPSGDTYCQIIGGIGASALADFTANKALTLPYHKGRVIGRYGTATGVAAWSPIIGQSQGEPIHTLIEAEMPSHTHGTSPGSSVVIDGATAGSLTFGPGALKDSGLVILATGSDQPHNNVQPSTFANAMIKL